MATEDKEPTTIVTWRPDFNAEKLMVSNWVDTDEWDFIGAVVDIQLRRANGDYFFVKYVGSVEGLDEDADVEEGDERPRVLYHFGVDKLDGRRWLFRHENIHCITAHHSSRVEKEKDDNGLSLFPLPTNKPITKSLIEKLDSQEIEEVETNTNSCCFLFGF